MVKKEKTIPPLLRTLTWNAHGQCYLYFVNKSKHSHPLMRVKELKMAESIANLTGYCIHLNGKHVYFFHDDEKGRTSPASFRKENI